MSTSKIAMIWQRLEVAVAGLRVVPKVPQGAKVVLPVEDAAESVQPVQARQSQPLALFITYADSKGQLSQRRVTIRQVIGDPPHMLLAYCHERRAARHFRLDRILEAADPETGEIYGLDELHDLIAGHGFAAVSQAMRRAINILVFLMRCDDEDHHREWLAVDQHLAIFAGMCGLDEQGARQASAMARQVAPDSDDFTIALRSFACSDDWEALGAWVSVAGQAVIDADGRHAKQEAEALVMVEQCLNDLGIALKG